MQQSICINFWLKPKIEAHTKKYTLVEKKYNNQGILVDKKKSDPFFCWYIFGVLIWLIPTKGMKPTDGWVPSTSLRNVPMAIMERPWCRYGCSGVWFGGEIGIGRSKKQVVKLDHFTCVCVCIYIYICVQKHINT